MRRDVLEARTKRRKKDVSSWSISSIIIVVVAGESFRVEIFNMMLYDWKAHNKFFFSDLFLCVHFCCIAFAFWCCWSWRGFRKFSQIVSLSLLSVKYSIYLYLPSRNRLIVIYPHQLNYSFPFVFSNTLQNFEKEALREALVLEERAIGAIKSIHIPQRMKEGASVTLINFLLSFLSFSFVCGLDRNQTRIRFVLFASQTY